MASNKDNVRRFYRDGDEDARATISRSGSAEFHYTKHMLAGYIGRNTKVIELGCATGYYGMQFAPRCAHYTGVDFSTTHIAKFQKKAEEAGLTNVTALVGDATNLTGIEDEGYDLVLCLGPMYHLPREERQTVFAECRRIAKPGAFLAFAYINAVGAYMGACMDEKYRKLYPNAEANRYVLEYATDDLHPGVFHYTSPEEMEQDAAAHKLTVVQNRGLNFSFAAGTIDAMDEQQYASYRRLADRMHQSPSCTGLAAHALLVCAK